MEQRIGISLLSIFHPSFCAIGRFSQTMIRRFILLASGGPQSKSLEDKEGSPTQRALRIRLALRSGAVRLVGFFVLWALWHLPNFVFPIAGVPPLGPFPVVAMWIIAETFLFTTLFRASINAFTFEGMDSTEKWMLQASIWTIAAFISVLSSRAMRTQPPPQTTV